MNNSIFLNALSFEAKLSCGFGVLSVIGGFVVFGLDGWRRFDSCCSLTCSFLGDCSCFLSTVSSSNKNGTDLFSFCSYASAKRK